MHQINCNIMFYYFEFFLNIYTLVSELIFKNSYYFVLIFSTNVLKITPIGYLTIETDLI